MGDNKVNLWLRGIWVAVQTKWVNLGTGEQLAALGGALLLGFILGSIA